MLDNSLILPLAKVIVEMEWNDKISNHVFALSGLVCTGTDMQGWNAVQALRQKKKSMYLKWFKILTNKDILIWFRGCSG